jgi:hypothetical protein
LYILQQYTEGEFITYKQLVKVILALLLVLMVIMPIALADDDVKNHIIVKDGNTKEEKNTEDSSLSDKTDKIISDDTVLGFKKNNNYNVSQDLRLQEGFDIASSLPPWKVFILFLLLLSVLVVLVVPTAVEWNILKGAKSATNENPVKAAQGIKDSKHINRDLLLSVGEGLFGLGLFLYMVFFLFM